MVRPEDSGWWEHMEHVGPRPWARRMFMTATVTLAMFDKPLKERLLQAYTQCIYPLFVARERCLDGEECPELEDVFYSFYDTHDYRAEPGEEPVKRTLEGMSGSKAKHLAERIVLLSFEVCAKIPPGPNEP